MLQTESPVSQVSQLCMWEIRSMLQTNHPSDSFLSLPGVGIPFVAGSAGNGLASIDVCNRHQKSQSQSLFGSGLYGKLLRSLFVKKLECDTQRPRLFPSGGRWG